METEFQATSHLYWIAALVAALMDIAFVALLAWHIKPARFRRLQWLLVIVSTLFWTVLWYAVMWNAFIWETSYRHVFQPWQRWIWPPVFGLISAGVSLLMWWLSVRLPGKPILNFLLLGGLVSFVDHYFAISNGVMETPLLQEVSIASAVTFGFFEFIFYWSVILALAALLPLVWDRWQAPKKEKGNSL